MPIGIRGVFVDKPSANRVDVLIEQWSDQAVHTERFEHANGYIPEMDHVYATVKGRQMEVARKVSGVWVWARVSWIGKRDGDVIFKMS